MGPMLRKKPGLVGAIKSLQWDQIQNPRENECAYSMLKVKSLGISGTETRYMSHVTRKPVFRVCDQVRLKPPCLADETS